MPTPYLHSLINSLTKSEKRYFKLNASINKTNKTLIKLFDILEKNKAIEKENLIKELGLKTKQNLAVAETRLQGLILKHLRGFHANTTQSIELNNLIIEIEILYNKRLFKNCKKLILKAKKLAETQENHLALLSILKWESFIEKEEGKYLHRTQENLTNILNQEKEIIDEYLSIVDFKFHTFNLLLLSKNKALSILNKELSKYELLIQNDYFNIKEDYPFDKKLYILNFMGMFCLSTGNLPKCLIQYNNLVHLIETSNRKNILLSSEYFLALNNLLLIQVLNHQFDDYNNTLDKIYQQFNTIETYKPLLFTITQNYELGIYCEIGEAEKGLSIIPGIEEKLKLYNSEINDINKLLFYFNIAIIYLLNKNYRKSIYWFNEYLNDYSIKKNDVASNIYYYSHIINLVVHFEAQNFDTIDYLFKESQKNLQKIRSINDFDNCVLNFIKDVAIEAPLSKKVTKEKFKSLNNQLKNIAKDKSQITALQFFDFFAWIESHLSDKKIPEIIKEKRMS